MKLLDLLAPRVRFSDVLQNFLRGETGSGIMPPEHLGVLVIPPSSVAPVDGPVQFHGRQLAQKRGRVAMPDGTSAWTKVTVYSTPEGEGVIREDIRSAGRTFTFVHRIHPGTSPSWNGPEQPAAAADPLDEAWDLACRVDERLRPVKTWSITGDYQEFRLPTGGGTFLVVRTGRSPRADDTESPGSPGSACDRGAASGRYGAPA